MRDFIYSEMMIHIPVCTSKEPENILIIGDDAELLKKEALKHNVNVDTLKCNIESLSSLSDDMYDVVVSKMGIDAALLAQLNRIMKKDAQFVTAHPSLDEVEENKKLMLSLSKYFKIIMPYNIGEGTTALFCSKEYHPTADVNLQRADMLDGLEYYNGDIHRAAFAMGNYIRKEYLGVIKN